MPYGSNLQIIQLDPSGGLLATNSNLVAQNATSDAFKFTVTELFSLGINDSATNTTQWWSSSRVSTLLAGKASTSHTHTKSSITDLEVITATPTGSAIVKASAGGKIDNGWLNTGSGNGLDADTIDGLHAVAFALASHTHTKSEISDLETITATATADAIVKANGSGKISNAWLNTGSGNGIDADLLDGNHASAFALVSHNHTKSNITDLETITTTPSNNAVPKANGSGLISVNWLATFIGDSGAGGTKGLVPAPAAGDSAANKYLHSDGTWQTPSGTGINNAYASMTDGTTTASASSEDTFKFRSSDSTINVSVVSNDPTHGDYLNLTVGTHSHTLSNISDVGTAAAYNVPASGDASSGEVVRGNDSRLTNSRTPTGGASGDLSGTYPGPTVAKIQGRNVSSNAPSDGQALVWNQTGTNWVGGTPAKALSLDDSTNVVSAAQARSHIDNASIHRTINDSGSANTDLWSASKIISELSGKAESSHTHTKSQITDLETITATPTNNAIVKADGLGKISNGWLNTGAGNGIDADLLDGNHASAFALTSHTHTLSQITDVGTSASYNVAETGDAASGEVVKGDDTRLTNARTPTAHASTHHLGGGDEINHDSLSGFVSNEHIDHSSVSITGSGGLSGGGDITTNRSISLDINSLTADGAPNGGTDYVLTYDFDAGTHKKVLLNNLPNAGGIASAFAAITDGTNTAGANGSDTFKIRSADNKLSVLVTNNDVTHGDNVLFTVNEANISHDNLSGFAADEHVPHSTISISAGDGLTGGGSIDGNVSLAVGTGTGISVSADAVSLLYSTASNFILSATQEVGAITTSDIILFSDNGTDVVKYAPVSALPFAASSHNHTLSQITDAGNIASQNANNISISGGSISGTNITLVGSAAPTPTANGRIEWDNDNFQIKIGDGTGTKIFSDDSVFYTQSNLQTSGQSSVHWGNLTNIPTDWSGTFDGQEGTYYLSRTNHTGTQTASTISDLSEAVDDRVAALIQNGTGLSWTYDDASNTLTGAVQGNTTTQRIRTSKGGTLTSTRQEINFIEGAGISLTLSDDSGNDRANLTITSTATGNMYASITDGTNTASASGSDTFKIRSANNILSLVVTNDDVTHGDNVLFTINQANIAHQSISGAGTNTHAQIDTHIGDATIHRSINDAGSGATDLWSASKISSELSGKANTSHNHTKSNITDLETITATPTLNAIVKADGTGKISNGWLNTGAGNGIDADQLDGLHASSFALSSHTHVLANITDAGTSASYNVAASGDAASGEVVKGDDTRLTNARTPTSHGSTHHSGGGDEVNHDSLAGFVSNEHVDHSSVSITGSGGLSGGGDITTNRSITLDINSLTADGSPSGSTDYVLTYDFDAGTHKKVLLNNLPNAGGIANAFATITDGTTPASANGSDVFKLRSSSGAISITTQNNDATHGDNADFGIANNAVTDAILRDSAALSIIGRSANTSGDPADISAGSDGDVLRRSGTTLGFGTIGSASIADAAITDAKLRNSSATSVIGRSAGTVGVPADIAAGSDNHVLRRSGGVLGFGTIDAASIGSGTLGLARGGTNATTYTASQLIRMNAGGTAFESSGKTVPTGTIVGTTDTQTLTNKTLTTPTLTLQAGTTPTADGRIQWDTTNDKIKVGDGVGTKTFSDDSVFYTQTNLQTSGQANVHWGNVSNKPTDWTGTFDGQEGTYYLSRANHTGTQAASTISDFSEAVDDRVASLIQNGTGLSWTYDDGANTLTGSVQNNTTTQKIEVLKGAAAIGTRKAINLIEGTGITLTMADDAGNDRVNITVASTATGNMYSSVTDGTTTATASGSDTFKLRSANNILSVAVQNDDGTHGDNALFTITEGNITHQNISGAGTNTHAQIDTHIGDATIHRSINDSGTSTTELWSASKISTELAGKANTSHTHTKSQITDLETITATPTASAIVKADGLNKISNGWLNTGAGNGIDADQLDGLHASSFALTSHTHTLSNITDAGTAAGYNVAAAGDAATGEVVKGDDTRLTNARTPTTHASSHHNGNSDPIDHDSLSGFVSNEHIDHSSISITGSNGISGGGNITANRSLSLDINSLTSDGSPVASTDYVVTYDASAETNKKVLLENLPFASSSHLHTTADITDITVSTTPGIAVVPKTESSSKINNGFLNTGSGNGLDADSVDGIEAIDLKKNWYTFYLTNQDVDATTGIKHTWYAPANGKIYGVFGFSHGSPTGVNMVTDVHIGGSTILTNKITIETSENTTTTATTPPSLTSSPTSFSAGAKFEFEIDTAPTTGGSGHGVQLLISWD